MPDLADITRKLAQCENKSAKRFLPLSLGEWISEELMDDVSVAQSSTSKVMKFYCNKTNSSSGVLQTLGLVGYSLA